MFITLLILSLCLYFCLSSIQVQHLSSLCNGLSTCYTQIKHAIWKHPKQVFLLSFWITFLTSKPIFHTWIIHEWSSLLQFGKAELVKNILHRQISRTSEQFANSSLPHSRTQKWSGTMLAFYVCLPCLGEQNAELAITTRSFSAQHHTCSQTPRGKQEELRNERNENKTKQRQQQ